MKLLFVIVALIFVKSVLLYKVYQALPGRELKRRARGKDAKAAAIYKAAAYSGSLELLFWIFGTASAIV